MCLVVLALGAHPRYPFVLAANRDEFHRRPTAAAHRWHDAADVVGGRDLEQGGTWLAFSRRGAFAIVTNYRDPARRRAGGRSRGYLTGDFAADKQARARDYVAGRLAEGMAYDGFNLIAGDAAGVWFGSNRDEGPRRLNRGIHGLSNHLLDTPWPKVEALKQATRVALDRRDDAIVASLFEALANRDQATDEALPRTGVSLEWERMLSAAFIVSSEYGTRSSTVATVDAGGRLVFEERSFDPGGNLVGTNRIEWQLDRPLGVSPAGGDA